MYQGDVPLQELVLELEPERQAERLRIVSKVPARALQSVGSYTHDNFAWAKGSLHCTVSTSTKYSYCLYQPRLSLGDINILIRKRPDRPFI